MGINIHQLKIFQAQMTMALVVHIYSKSQDVSETGKPGVECLVPRPSSGCERKFETEGGVWGRGHKEETMQMSSKVSFRSIISL